MPTPGSSSLVIFLLPGVTTAPRIVNPQLAQRYLVVGFASALVVLTHRFAEPIGMAIQLSDHFGGPRCQFVQAALTEFQSEPLELKGTDAHDVPADTHLLIHAELWPLERIHVR